MRETMLVMWWGWMEIRMSVRGGGMVRGGGFGGDLETWKSDEEKCMIELVLMKDCD